MNKMLSFICIFFILLVQRCVAEPQGGVDPAALREQMARVAREPLSFFKIGADQKIHFYVSSRTMTFYVDVYSDPKPRIEIELALTSRYIDPADETWGHQVEMKSPKMLSEADMKYLESYLAACRDRGVHRDTTKTSPSGWQEFEFQQLIGGQWGFVKRECYNLKPGKEDDSDFIKWFVGLAPTR